MGKPVEVLLVHRRYTYAFAAFVHGHHRGFSGISELEELLRGMTVSELLLVDSGDFRRMYDFLWANQEVGGDLYARKAQKFARNFGDRPDDRKRLRAMVRAASPIGRLWWEPPKGRPAREHETGTACAIRETKEETGVGKEHFTLLLADRFVATERYTQKDTTYHHVYYGAAATGALARTDEAPRLFMHSPAQIAEIDDVRWMTLADVAAIDHDGRLGATVCRLVRSIGRNWFGRRYTGGGRHGRPPSARRRPSKSTRSELRTSQPLVRPSARALTRGPEAPPLSPPPGLPPPGEDGWQVVRRSGADRKR